MYADAITGSSCGNVNTPGNDSLVTRLKDQVAPPLLELATTTSSVLSAFRMEYRSCRPDPSTLSEGCISSLAPLVTALGAPHVAPPSVDLEMSTWLFPVRPSFQVT